MHFHRQLIDTLNISSGRTILRIKAIRPSCVLELQGVDGRTIWDHSKNCAPCHLPNLDPTIITSTWIPPLDYPCQICRRTNDANQMLLCDNCNGGYPFIMPQVEAHSSFCGHLVLFIMFSCITLISTQTMPWFFWLRSRGPIIENFISVSSCALYIYVCIFFWLISFYL